MIDDKLTQELKEVNDTMLAVQTEITKATANFQTQLEELREQDKKLREAIETAMRDNDVKKFENDVVAITYVAPSTRTTIDTKKFQAEQPELAKQYERVSQVKDSVRIKVK